MLSDFYCYYCIAAAIRKHLCHWVKPIKSNAFAGKCTTCVCCWATERMPFVHIFCLKLLLNSVSKVRSMISTTQLSWICFIAIYRCQRNIRCGMQAKSCFAPGLLTPSLTDEEIVKNYFTAAQVGVSKVMAKMGISTLHSYKVRRRRWDLFPSHNHPCDRIFRPRWFVGN